MTESFKISLTTISFYQPKEKNRKREKGCADVKKLPDTPQIELNVR
jgi:hypothetical protein